MKPEIKRQWVTALKSGEHVQGTSFLHIIKIVDPGEQLRNKPDSYCCLGVLCKTLKIKEEHGFSSNRYFEVGSFAGNRCQLTDEILEQTGLSHAEQQKLMSMNDSGHSFEEIATWIERNL